MEKTKKERKPKKSEKSKVTGDRIINIFFFVTLHPSLFTHICRNRKEKGKGVKTPFCDFGKSVDNFSGTEFGPGSKGVPD